MSATDGLRGRDQREKVRTPASLYLVIEGWQELGIQDSEADELLRSPHVDLLKRYRNGVFHYQRDMWDERFMAFIRVPSLGPGDPPGRASPD